MPIVRLPFNFKSRPYQEDLMRAIFVEGKKRIFLCWHRRSGKDLSCINIVIALACQRVGTHLYALPMATQARRVIFSGMTKEGIRFIDRIPKELVSKVNSTEMSIQLVNGSKIIFAGTDNLDGLIGGNFISIVLSEFSLHSPVVLPLLSPILRENGGTLILNMTPRGANHAHDIYQAVKDNPDWYTSVLGINDTKDSDGNPILTEDDLNKERASGVDERLIQQEFHCSWNSANVGSYYSEELDRAEKEGRICELKPSSSRPTWVFMDIGFDSTACWFVQPNGKFIDVIYHLERVDKDMQFMINEIRDVAKKLNVTFKDFVAPHDIRNREWGGGRSRVEVAQQMGINFRVAPKLPIDDGIQAVKSIFPKLRFDKFHCKMGLQSLKEYRREYDMDRKIFKSKPLHSWASHSSDALRYFAVYWQDLYMRPQAAASVPYSMDSFIMERDKPQPIDPVQAQFKSVLEGVKSNLKGK